MVDLLSVLPLSPAGILSTFVSAFVAFIALVIADKVIAHQIDAKRLFILSFLALFITPLVLAFVVGTALPGIVVAYLIPLVIWILLGEVLLGADRMMKLKVAAVGFFVYLILNITIAPYLFAFLPF